MESNLRVRPATARCMLPCARHAAVSHYCELSGLLWSSHTDGNRRESLRYISLNSVPLRFVDPLPCLAPQRLSSRGHHPATS